MFRTSLRLPLSSHLVFHLAPPARCPAVICLRTYDAIAGASTPHLENLRLPGLFSGTAGGLSPSAATASASATGSQWRDWCSYRPRAETKCPEVRAQGGRSSRRRPAGARHRLEVRHCSCTISKWCPRYRVTEPSVTCRPAQNRRRHRTLPWTALAPDRIPKPVRQVSRSTDYNPAPPRGR